MAPAYNNVPLQNPDTMQTSSSSQSTVSVGQGPHGQDPASANPAVTTTNTSRTPQNTCISHAASSTFMTTSSSSSTTTPPASQYQSLPKKLKSALWKAAHRLLHSTPASSASTSTATSPGLQSSGSVRRLWSCTKNVTLALCALIAAWMTFSIATWTAAKDWKLYCDDHKEDHSSGLTLACKKTANSELSPPPWTGGWFRSSNHTVAKRDGPSAVEAYNSMHALLLSAIPFTFACLLACSCRGLLRRLKTWITVNTSRNSNKTPSGAPSRIADHAPTSVPRLTSNQPLEATQFANVRQRISGFNSESYAEKCSTMNETELQQEWEKNTRLLRRALASTPIFGTLPFTLGDSGINFVVSASVIRRARKKRAAIERNLLDRFGHGSHIYRDVMASRFALDSSANSFTIGVGDSRI